MLRYGAWLGQTRLTVYLTKLLCIIVFRHPFSVYLKYHLRIAWPIWFAINAGLAPAVSDQQHKYVSTDMIFDGGVRHVLSRVPHLPY